MQVAVVHANQRSIEGFQGPLQLIAVVDFHQYVEVDAFGHGCQFGHFHVIQRGHDQQHAIGTQGTGFDDLVGIDHEVLADHR
ncbi:hypothetical protein D3C72_1593430 [compost metagenome]